MAIRDDEVAAEPMGINTRNLKLLAFGLGASFAGVAGVMFGIFQGFISPEAFTLQESVLVVAMVVFGGIGHIPSVILGAVLLNVVLVALRYVVGPLEAMTDGRLDAGIMRQLLIALAMVAAKLLRPRGLCPRRSMARRQRSAAFDQASRRNSPGAVAPSPHLGTGHLISASAPSPVTALALAPPHTAYAR